MLGVVVAHEWAILYSVAFAPERKLALHGRKGWVRRRVWVRNKSALCLVGAKCMSATAEGSASGCGWGGSCAGSDESLFPSKKKREIRRRTLPHVGGDRAPGFRPEYVHDYSAR